MPNSDQLNDAIKKTSHVCHVRMCLSSVEVKISEGENVSSTDIGRDGLGLLAIVSLATGKTSLETSAFTGITAGDI